MRREAVHTSSGRRLCWAALAMIGVAGAPAWAAQPPACRPDVHPERELFAGHAHAVAGGTTAAGTPTVQPGRLYQVRLAPQLQVRYLAPPGKAMLTAGAHGGMLKFRVPHSGSYRVSLDAAFWIDVVADGKLLDSEDFFAQRGCGSLHKVVVYRMPAGQDLWLQISGAPRAQAQIALTEAPAATDSAAAH